MTEELLTKNFFDLQKSDIYYDLLKNTKYPWEALPEIKNLLQALLNSLSRGEFEQYSEDVLVAKNVSISEFATIKGPCVIMPGAEVRPGAFIRGNVLICENVVAGNSSELKNVILMHHVQVPHYNYVGDSILAPYAHMGAGSITSNLRADRHDVTVHIGADNIVTNLHKFGAIIGEHAEVGCNAVLNPGTVIGRYSQVYPLTSVRKSVPACSIHKQDGSIVSRVLEN